MLRNHVIYKSLLRAFFIALFIFLIIPNHSAAKDQDLYIAKGIQMINDGKFSEAVESLNRALAVSPDNLEANYYAGVAHSRLGNYQDAENLFLKTLELGETGAHVYFELGRLYYITSRCAESKEHLSKFKTLSDDVASNEYASKLVETCTEEDVEKKYRLQVSVGGQHDSNVILEPTNPVVPADRDSDIRALIYVSAGAEIFNIGALSLRADYNFYQSIHDQLDDFDIHYHKIKPSLELDISRR
jgi:tetratricopeptide (TPR) repeat protein